MIRPEPEVLALVAAGHPNRDIAKALLNGLDTLTRHVCHLFAKLASPIAPKPRRRPAPSGCWTKTPPTIPPRLAPRWDAEPALPS